MDFQVHTHTFGGSIRDHDFQLKLPTYLLHNILTAVDEAAVALTGITLNLGPFLGNCHLHDEEFKVHMCLQAACNFRAYHTSPMS